MHVDTCVFQGPAPAALGERAGERSDGKWKSGPGDSRVAPGQASALGTEVRVMRRRKGQGLSHSLRCLALHTNEARLHKSDLAGGCMPAQAPGQAGHLGAQDLDPVTASEGHLFGS